jgi:hypothetical protein
MTPPAATAAARHRAAAAPARPARRISGPATAPRRQAPPRRRPAAVPRPSRRDLPLGARGLEWLQGLPDHRLLDRLIGGRAWIVLIGTLLVGIVTLQLSLLKLNAGIGRAVERSTVLQQGNTALEAEVSQLSDPQRIVAQAQLRGFVTPPQGSPRFLTASAGDARAALGVMRVPSQSAVTMAAVTTTAAATTTPGAAATSAGAVTTTPAAATTTAPAAATTTPAPAVTTAPVTTGATPAPAGTPASTPATPAAAGGAAPPVGPQG